MRTLGLCFVAAGLLTAAPLQAAEMGEPPIARSWQHDGFFGTIDRAAAQRGYQVYREICSGCHGLEYVPFRSLAGIGYSEDEIKAIAEEYSITDGPDEDGDAVHCLRTKAFQ